jgi:5-methylcytosine-specific restriction endonuclease McrA
MDLWWVNPELKIYKKYSAKLYRLKAWRIIRSEILNDQPFCSVCNYREATQVDHIESLRQIFNRLYIAGDLDLFFDAGLNKENLRPICKLCNTKKSWMDKVRKYDKKDDKERTK